MTIKEAMVRGLTAIRSKTWNEYACLRLDRTPDGLYGPWAHIWDPGAVVIGNLAKYSWSLPVFSFADHNDFEEWTEEHQRRFEEHDAANVKIGWKTAMPNYQK